MIYRLPENMKVGATTAGWVSATSIDANILTIKDGTVFNTSNPTSGYDPKVVLGGNFTMWRDVIVWPNNGGRTINGASTAEASVPIANTLSLFPDVVRLVIFWQAEMKCLPRGLFTGLV